MTYDTSDLLFDLALAMQARVSPRTAIHLMSCFGSARAIYEATFEELTLRAELKEVVAREILAKRSFAPAERELQFMQRNDIRALSSLDPRYPQLLKECEDYPHVLYMRGNLDLNRGRWLSVVGTRKGSPYGLRMCERLVSELAEQVPNLVLVSGLAYGIDAAIHRAALRQGVPTVAVMAQGLQKIYPPTHTQLSSQMIKEGGALLSEFTSFAPTFKGNFVQRNRIVAGISEGTLVVESPSKGGSLITADLADGYHRSVMALPGRIDDPNSEGTNQLIRSLRAGLVNSSQQIVQTLGWEEPPRPEAIQGMLSFEASEPSVLSEVAEASASRDLSEIAEVSEPSDLRVPIEGSEKVAVNLWGEPSAMTSESVLTDEPASAFESVLKDESAFASTPASTFDPNPPSELTSSELTSSEPTRSVSPTALDLDSAPIPTFPSASSTPVSTPAPSTLTSYERVMREAKPQQNTSERVLSLLDREQAKSFDQLFYLSGLSTGALSLVLIELELSGEILPLPGKYYLRC